jgi:transposase-like protein
MEREKKRATPYYSESLKRQVVREYSGGYYSKVALMEKYGILGSNTIDDWLEKYGTFTGEAIKEKQQLRMTKASKKRKSKQEEDTELPEGTPKPVKGQRLWEQERISELEAQLEKEKLRQLLYLRIINLASEEYGEDLLKKIGIAQLKAQKKVEE